MPWFCKNILRKIARRQAKYKYFKSASEPKTYELRVYDDNHSRIVNGVEVPSEILTSVGIVLAGSEIDFGEPALGLVRCNKVNDIPPGLGNLPLRDARYVTMPDIVAISINVVCGEP